jgi:glyoxylase-like metal-dependent hydrolase (beta-lactamase superfamily II)
MRYQWLILQSGEIPLRPSGAADPSLEHRCTSVLVWPEGQAASHDNAVLTDPCFTLSGFDAAAATLAGIGASFADIAHVFVTHAHGDHTAHVLQALGLVTVWRPPFDALPGGFHAIPCPGHAPDLHALVFRAVTDEEVWVVGDAILDEEWLRAWAYYWPNRYGPSDIAQTWHTVAAILARADLILPGHGAPIRVTASLLEHLADHFPAAAHSDACPDVLDALRARLAQLRP